MSTPHTATGHNTNKGEFDLDLIRCDIQKQELNDLLSKKLNRAPDTNDYYKISKDLFEMGAYSRAMPCLRYYLECQGAQTAGRHLLAFCLLYLGEKEDALNEFKKCVKEGFQEDWQMVVELLIELEKEN